jgi:starch phosphorylase
VEADSLFEILERQIVPLYYERRGERFHRDWVHRIKESLASLGPKVQASRMVRDYVETMYEPIARRAEHLSEAEHGRAKALAAWKQRVVSAWPGVAVVSVESETGTAPVDLGGVREVTAQVELGGLGADDVDVQLIHGQVAVNDELTDTEAISMTLVGPPPKGAVSLTYTGRFACDRAGRHGYTVRVVPAHPDLAFPVEMGCISWA